MSCSSCRTCGRVAGADDRRQAELATDDGRVRGATAMIGDECGRSPHDRHPVRIGGPRHEHRAVDEPADVARALDQADRPCDGRIADAEAFREHPALVRNAVGLEPARRAPRLHGLGPRLHDEERPAFHRLWPTPCPSACRSAPRSRGPSGQAARSRHRSGRSAPRSASDVGTSRVGAPPSVA